jgi:biopolymer transport protein ExbD
MAFHTQGDSEDVVSEINVTPLVDVMLVLLVVFIVTAPLLTNAIKVNLPETSPTAPPEEKKATDVSVDAQGKVYIDKREVSVDSLETEFQTLKDADPDVALHLHADEVVAYGVVAKVMAAVEHTGITKLSVLTIAQ